MQQFNCLINHALLLFYPSEQGESAVSCHFALQALILLDLGVNVLVQQKAL